MDCCKFCGCTGLVKSGFVRGKQRYQCKLCLKNQVDGDGRVKYSNETRLLALKMYVNNGGIRAIGRVLNVPFQLVSQWVSKAGVYAEDLIKQRNQTTQDIEIMEMDELYTYIQKNKERYAYGLRWTGTGCVWLISTSEVEAGDMPDHYSKK